MKKIIILIAAITMIIACGRKPVEKASPSEDSVVLNEDSLLGEQLLMSLNEQHLSLLVWNHDSTFVHSGRGVKDLLQLIQTNPDRLNGAIVADKIIGKAAAALMATGGVKRVHTNIICTPARELLEEQDIAVVAHEEVLMILNRDRSGMCPIDSQIDEAQTVEQCVAILEAM